MSEKKKPVRRSAVSTLMKRRNLASKKSALDETQRIDEEKPEKLADGMEDSETLSKVQVDTGIPSNEAFSEQRIADNSEKVENESIQDNMLPEISTDNAGFAMPIDSIADYDNKPQKPKTEKPEKAEKPEKSKKAKTIVVESEKWVERSIETGIDEQIPFGWKIDLTMPDKKAPLNKLMQRIQQDITSDD